MNYLLLFLTALSMGFMGSLHCMGMCGGIATAYSYSSPTRNLKTLFFYQLMYSVGRISSYSLLGMIAGFSGLSLLQAFGLEHTAVLRYIAAVMLILLGLYLTGWWSGLVYIERLGRFIWQPLRKLGRFLLPVTNLWRAFGLGILWGFLPCGLVYSALAFAVSTCNEITGAIFMACFGLGTLPALLLIGSAAKSYQRFFQHRTTRAALGVVMIGFGVWAILVIYTHHGIGMDCHGYTLHD